MIDARLTTTKKNDIFHSVKLLQFDPAEFEWTEYKKPQSREQVLLSKLIHKRTDYFCLFTPTYLELSPGEHQRVEGVQAFQWQDAIPIVNSWLDRLRGEVDTEDLWAAVAKEREFSDAASSDINNTPFTPDERSDISRKLDEVKQYIQIGQQFQTEQAKHVEDQFAYLNNALNRLGRKDWLNIAYSTFLNVALSVALPPERIKGLLQFAGVLFRSAWEHAAKMITS